MSENGRTRLQRFLIVSIEYFDRRFAFKLQSFGYANGYIWQSDTCREVKILTSMRWL
jgi:hypothetical protein